MVTVTVAEARDRLTQLLKAVEQGEKVIICRHGKPIVSLVPFEVELRQPRIFGARRGIKVLDPAWAKPQNDAAAWLRGDV